MIDKEQASQTIFGIGRSDGCTLASITQAQEAAILETLALTDEVDKVYDQQGGLIALETAFSLAREMQEQVIAFLPDKDIRTMLLGTTLKAYENCITLAVGAELNHFNGDAAATVATARMRKLFLKKILNGDLDPNAQDFLNYLIVTEHVGKNGHTKISLPPISKSSGATAHVFPVQVSIQTQEFIQAVLFYAILADSAAGEYVRLPDALQHIEKKLIDEGLDKQQWERGWNYLQKYQTVFNNTIFQNVVILMRSHWDWYIRQIGDFVSVARAHVSSPPLDRTQKNDLERIGWKEITKQLLILEVSCGISFRLAPTILTDLYEMSLVRNLGMHNRWEVDEFYLRKTTSSNWELRDVRIIEIGELQSWASSLSRLINETSLQIATKYAAAPDFP